MSLSLMIAPPVGLLDVDCVTPVAGGKRVSPLLAFSHHCQRLIMKQPSCGDSPLTMTPKSLRYKDGSRGNMRKIGGINGSHGRFDGQPMLGR
jgi:hypothetical protein